MLNKTKKQKTHVLPGNKDMVLPLQIRYKWIPLDPYFKVTKKEQTQDIYQKWGKKSEGEYMEKNSYMKNEFHETSRTCDHLH